MDCGEMIIAEDYVDLIINSAYFDVNTLSAGCYVYVNERIVNLYVPKTGLPSLSLDYYGYESIPKLYTIMEETENVADSIAPELANRQNLDGRGILLGFVDTGIDYEGPFFRNPDGTTRIRYLWDQTIPGQAPEGFFYGSQYVKADIDEALRSPNPRDVVPSRDENGHGTYVASVACGAGVGYQGKPASDGEKEKAALYVRLSSKDDRSNSIENQIFLLEQFVARGGEFEVAATYVDDGRSGRNFDRPQFQRMLRQFVRQEGGCLIVKDFSRLGRNYLETGAYVEEILPLMNVRLISVLDGYDSARDFMGEGWLERNLTHLVNEAYLQDASRRMRRSVEERRSRGAYLGSHAPYGFEIAREQGIARLVRRERPARMVTMIFRSYARSGSVSQVAAFLRRWRVQSPGDYERSGRLFASGEARSWPLSTLVRMLRDERYSRGEAAMVSRALWDRCESRRLSDRSGES